MRSEQTNLLALNAAIESARAGKQEGLCRGGKRVRKLANNLRKQQRIFEPSSIPLLRIPRYGRADEGQHLLIGENILQTEEFRKLIEAVVDTTEQVQTPVEVDQRSRNRRQHSNHKSRDQQGGCCIPADCS